MGLGKKIKEIIHNANSKMAPPEAKISPEEKITEALQKNFAEHNVSTKRTPTTSGYNLKFFFIRSPVGDDKDNMNAVSNMRDLVTAEMKKRGFTVESCNAGYAKENESYFVEINCLATDLERAREVERGYGFSPWHRC